MRLADQVAAREAAVFVGRERELAVLRGLLAEDSPHRVAFVTGPAGSGKSALLRALVRYADDRAPVVIDPAGTARPDAALRDRLAALPATARVVVAADRPPDGDWWRSPWAASLLVLPLEPLPARTADDLLAARGVADVDERTALVGWADGHPLSLALAAGARVAAGRPLADNDLGRLEDDLLEQLTRGLLTGPDLLARDRAVLAVAALAPAVDASLLAAVLPDRPAGDAEAAERWLRGLAFAVPLGARVSLVPRVRRVLAGQLRRTEPDLERTLRLRIIDHLSRAGTPGRAQLVLDIREVLDAPQDRGFGPARARSGPWLVGGPRPGDGPVVAALLAGADPAHRRWVARWLDEAPEAVVVVRRSADPAGAPVALAVGTTPGSVPAALADDGPLRGWCAWVADRDERGPALLTPVTEVWAEPAEEAEVAALLLAALVEACAVPDFRWWLVPRRPGMPDPAHCGGVPDPALDLAWEATVHPGFAIDYGPAGIVAAMREQARASWSADPVVTVDEVREALREVREPGPGPGSPYAARLPEALAHAFGPGADGRLLRAIVERGYLDPDAGHAHAMRELHLSRTTYFRRLREAVALLAVWLTADPAGGAVGSAPGRAPS